MPLWIKRILAIPIFLMGIFLIVVGISLFFNKENVGKEFQNGSWAAYQIKSAVIDSVIMVQTTPNLNWRSNAKKKAEQEKYLSWKYVVRYPDEYGIDRIDTVNIAREENKSELDYRKGATITVYYDPNMVLPLLSESVCKSNVPSKEKNNSRGVVGLVFGFVFIVASYLLWRKPK